MKFRLLLVSSLCAPAFGGCLPISGDRILGRDLAVANPQFAGLPAGLTLGFAPSPGMKRIFASSELARIAKNNGIEIANPQESCFEIPMRKLTEIEAMAAMRGSLPAGAEVGIVELSSSDVPVGEVEFQLAGLEPTAGAIQIWHGNVRFTPTRKTPVWARVTISQRLNAVVAGRDLAANAPVTAEALRVMTWAGPLVRERVALRMEDVLGRVPKKALKAGALIPMALLDDAPSVRRGDSIRVEVESGPARLVFHAIAEKDSRDGDLVELRNPVSGKTFRARLAGSKAVVVVDAGMGL